MVVTMTSSEHAKIAANHEDEAARLLLKAPILSSPLAVAQVHATLALSHRVADLVSDDAEDHKVIRSPEARRDLPA